MKQSKLSRFTQEYPVEENTMKQIKLSKCIQAYPVGENIKSYFDPCKEVAEIIEKEFPNKSITFWCRGSSGAMISALVCQHLDNVNIFHVKKENEISHYSSIDRYNEINIIIDDLMASGSTVECIYQKMIEKSSKVHSVIMIGEIKVYKIQSLIPYEIQLIVGGNII